MMPEQATLLEEAHDKTRAARMLADQGFYGIAGVIAAFGQYFANVGRVPKALHGILIRAEKLRITSDYNHQQIVTAEQAEAQIAYAEEFLAAAEYVIGPLSSADREAE